MHPFEYLRGMERKSIDQLKEFLRFPSVSALSRHSTDMKRCALWVKSFLDNIGIKAKMCETKAHPIVIADFQVSDKVPTVLVYGHYDVQPADPLELWNSAPFEPLEKNGYLFARGASDDKGQVFVHMKACESYLKTANCLPVNVRFVIEGEEEIGSRNLFNFLTTNKDLLKSDVAIISDGLQFAKDIPALTYGVRGICGLEVKIVGPRKDLHSGSFGGGVANPINILCSMISQLHDEHGRITIDGFYNDVYIPTEQEKELLKSLPFDKGTYSEKIGVPELWGEEGFSTYERVWIRPTLDCNGIKGGYQDEGMKTIIPSYASTKITMRLVPSMDPTDILNKTENFLRKICPSSVTMEITRHGGAHAIQIPLTNPWLDAASRALETGFGRKPVFIKEGGSLPVVEAFKTILGIDTLLVGFGQMDDDTHSPNEHFAINDFHRGCRTSASLFEEIAKVKIK